jgi:hypothetical protein
MRRSMSTLSLSLLRKGEHPNNVRDRLVEETMQRVGANSGWSRENEIIDVRRRILCAYNNVLLKDYNVADGIPTWLPGEFHDKWAEALEKGRRPGMGHNRFRFCVKSYSTGSDSAETPTPRVFLSPFKAIDPQKLEPRIFLYANHYRRGSVSAVIAPGGTGKTSLVMVEGIAIATGRPLLGEMPRERCRVWIHNGDDDTTELDRRIIAVCQHYNIPQQELEGWLFRTSGAEMPLKVAHGFGDLKIDNALIGEMTRAIQENSIDLVILDPLVTIHSVGENDNGKVDAVIRLFARMASDCDCAIDISHHTRKQASGLNIDHGVDDSRGAGAFRDACRSMRVLNPMSKEDGKSLFGDGDEFERLSYFRVDRGKSNAVAPARSAVWRKFENISLANGDDVGVVVPWEHPGTVTGASEAAKDIFLRVLDRYEELGRSVSDKKGTNYAPALFADEPEARKARMGKGPLATAMQGLFASGTITLEPSKRADRPNSARIIRNPLV